MGYIETLTEDGILRTFVNPFIDAMPNQDISYFYMILWGFTVTIIFMKSQNIIVPLFMIMIGGALIANENMPPELRGITNILIFLLVFVTFYMLIKWRS